MAINELANDKEVIEECIKYNNAMNQLVGIILFSLGVGCVGTPNPQRMALVGLMIVIPIIIYAYKRFPPTIKTLRQLKKETNDDEVSHLLCQIEKNHLNIKIVISDYLVYLAGILFYTLVLFSEDFVWWIKAASS